MKVINKKNLTLLVLAVAGGRPLTPVQLQKSVFLLQKRLPEGVLSRLQYEFVPYNYGPFSEEVYKDARSLADEGLATIQKPQNQLEYAANEHGIKRGMALLEQMPDEVAKQISDIASWVQQQSFRSLVSAIYDEYPEYRVKSIFKG